MSRISFLSALVLAAVPVVSSFTVSSSRHLTHYSKPQAPYRQQQQHHVRTNTVELKGVIEIMDLTPLIPVGLFFAGVAATSMMNGTSVDTVVVEKEDLMAAKEAIGVAEDETVVAVLEEELKEAIKEVEAAPAPKAEPAPKPAPPVVKAPPPPPAPKPVPPPPPPKPEPVVVKAPPPAAPKPAPKPEPVVAKTTPPPAPAVETVTPSPPAAVVPDLPPAAPTPRFNAFRKKTEKSLSELKREVSSTLEGEREKGERLRQAAAKRETQVVSKVGSDISTAKAATTAAAATVVASAKNIKLKKSSKSAAPPSTTTDSAVDDTADDTESADTNNDEPVEKKGLRRKAWRVVKKVVAPWRKWKNIK